MKRPVYSQNQYNLQPTYQNSRYPLVLRQSQAVKPAPVQGIYTNQGFLQTSPGHALHEARVQAALSVADDKQSTGHSQSQAVFQFTGKPQVSQLESSFEKELAELVAANRAAELKVKPAPHHQSQPIQYIQAAPQKPAYTLVPSPKQKQYTYLRPEVQTQKYLAPAVASRGKLQKYPQQYLIETTKPQPTQPAQLRPVALKQRPQPQPQQQPQQQYIQVSTEEPKFYEYQSYQEKLSPMKIVSAPQLQHQAPIQYKQYSQKESQEPIVPPYLQYYQTVKAQPEEANPANNVKLETYVSRFGIQQQKAQSSAPIPSEEQPTYLPKYAAPIKQEEPKNYVRYKSIKPQLTEYSSEDESLIQTLYSQAFQKPQQQGLSGFSTPKAADAKPQISAGPSHSSIYVSKSLAAKKKITPKIEAPEEPEEEIQTVRLPPPKNNKVYTQDEFQALVAAGYSVTPVPVVDDEESNAGFSPAPVNYPGHSKYQRVTPAPEQTYQKESSETYSTATQAPRTRKVQRRRPANQPRYRIQSESAQAESESQPQYAYASESQESSGYGLKKQTRSRVYQTQEDEEV